MADLTNAQEGTGLVATQRPTACPPEMTGEPGEIVVCLRDVLGDDVTAAIVGLSDPHQLNVLARGRQQPNAATVGRLRAGLNVVELLLPYEAPDTIRAWFVGKNQALGDQAPAVVVGDDPEAVIGAARAFVAYG